MPESELPGIQVRVVSAPAPIEAVDTSVAAFAGHTSAQHVREAVRVESLRDFEEAFGALRPDEELGYAVHQYFANGGTAAWVVAAPAGTPLPDVLSRLDAAGPLGLLCLPGETDVGVWREALGYAARRGAFVLVDPPGVDLQQALALARTLAGAPGVEGRRSSSRPSGSRIRWTAGRCARVLRAGRSRACTRGTTASAASGALPPARTGSCPEQPSSRSS